jgi:hypothetical protein
MQEPGRTEACHLKPRHAHAFATNLSMPAIQPVPRLCCTSRGMATASSGAKGWWQFTRLHIRAVLCRHWRPATPQRSRFTRCGENADLLRATSPLAQALRGPPGRRWAAAARWAAGRWGWLPGRWPAARPPPAGRPRLPAAQRPPWRACGPSTSCFSPDARIRFPT